MEAVQAGRQPGGEVGGAELAAEGEPGPGPAPIPAPPAGQYNLTIVILGKMQIICCVIQPIFDENIVLLGLTVYRTIQWNI